MVKPSTILVELQEAMGSDASIANAAWSSTYDKDKRDVRYDDAEKVNDIVRRIILDRHGVPVESVIFRFWIRMPIFADRQHMTHRMASHNGLSARYRTLPLDYFSVPSDVSEILSRVSTPNLDLKDLYDQSCSQAVTNYKISIDILKSVERIGQISNAEFKRVREVIRAQMPTAGMVERTTIMNLRSFANYQKQRNSSHAQPEIQTVARLMLEEVKKANIAPVAIETLESIGWSF